MGRVIDGDEIPLEGPVVPFPSKANDTHSWTREWWNELPMVIRNGDVTDVEGQAAFTLLKYLDGPGHIAGRVREYINDFYDGVFTDPRRVPNGKPLAWLALMLGVKRAVSDTETRARLIAVTEEGRAPVGTRRAITDVAKPYLVGDNRLRVQPSKTDPFLVDILVPSVSIPPEGMDWLARQIMDAGVVPAGHRVNLVAVTSSWDAWEREVEVDKGWARVEVNIPRWRDSEARGIVIP